MSVSKWLWTPDCDYGICINDCDHCEKAEFKEGEDNESSKSDNGDRIRIDVDIRKRLG